MSGDAAAAEVACSPVVGQVVSVEGELLIQDGTSWSPAILGRSLCREETIRTGDRSRAAVVLTNGSVLRLDEATTVRLADIALEDSGRSVLDLLFGAVRREVRRAAGQGVGWRAVIDAVRPHVQILWAEMTPADKQRFLRHVRPWWDVHRHRMAPNVAATLTSLRASGALRVHAGRIASITPEEGGLRVAWQRKQGIGEQQILAQRVIDCTGLATDVTKLDDPLIQQLLEEGLIRPASMRLGLDCTTYGAVIDAHGQPSQRLYAVGPITRGALWEITAVPEIRGQAEQVAANILTAARARFAAAA